MIRTKKLPITPVTLRETLERLGPIYVKIGQYLALRPDLLPQEYCDELLSLVDVAEFFPWPEARAILLEDFGPNVFDLFTTIDPVPVAAASLAQVYRAVALTGESVAIKIQRPGIAQRVEHDFKQLALVQPLVDLFHLLPGVKFSEVIDEMRVWMTDELSLDLEQRNMKHLRQLLAHDRRVRIPWVDDALSSNRVITMEYLSGVGFAALLRAVQSGVPAPFGKSGPDRDALAENLLRSCLDQVFRHHFFHADLHPGNLIALDENVVGFVDFGLVEVLDSHLEPGVRRFVSAAYLDDVEGMLEALISLLIKSPDADIEAFQAEFRRQYQIWQRHQNMRGTGESPLREYMIGVMRVARPYGMRLPASLLSMYRSILTAETVAGRLGGHADLVSTGRSFFAGLRLERLFDHLQPDQIERSLLPWLNLLEEPAQKYLRFFSEIAEGHYVLKVENAESASTRHNANLRTQLIATAVCLVALSMLAAAFHGVALFILAMFWLADAAYLIFQWRRLK